MQAGRVLCALALCLAAVCRATADDAAPTFDEHRFRADSLYELDTLRARPLAASSPHEIRWSEDRIFLHAPGVLKYRIPKGVTKFRATGELTEKGEVRFLVRVDGNELFKSEPVREGGKVEIDVLLPPYAKVIELVSDSNGTLVFDHALWVQPHFEISPVSQELKSFPEGSQLGGSRGRGNAAYEESFAAAERESFKTTIERLAATGNFNSRWTSKSKVWAYFLTVGFATQWLLMYLLRRFCGLPDIDWMVLPGRLSEISIREDFAGLPQTLQRFSPLLLICCLFGCGERFDPRFGTDAHESRIDAAARGRADGTEAGITKALAIAKSGEYWRFYPAHAVSAAIVGAVVGFLVQYTYLVSIRHSGRLNGMWSFILVPAIRHSFVYDVFVQRREFMVWMKDELAKMRANQRLRRAQLEAVKVLAHNKAVMLSDLDEIIQAKLLEAANSKLEDILATAEREAFAANEADLPVDPPLDDIDAVEAEPVESEAELRDQRKARARAFIRWLPKVDSVTYHSEE